MLFSLLFVLLGYGITYEIYIIASQCLIRTQKTCPKIKFILRLSLYIPRATRLTAIKKKWNKRECILSMYKKFTLVNQQCFWRLRKVLFFAIFNVFVELWWIPYRRISLRFRFFASLAYAYYYLMKLIK